MHIDILERDVKPYIFPVSSEGPPHSIASSDTQGDVAIVTWTFMGVIIGVFVILLHKLSVADSAGAGRAEDIF